ncbi:hypothetical protein G3A39_40780 [Paraburkholderia aspalathi]|nr:hypothetical protein [Paraburkholderia aspalathi]
MEIKYAEWVIETDDGGTDLSRQYLYSNVTDTADYKILVGFGFAPTISFTMAITRPKSDSPIDVGVWVHFAHLLDTENCITVRMRLKLTEHSFLLVGGAKPGDSIQILEMFQDGVDLILHIESETEGVILTTILPNQPSFYDAYARIIAADFASNGRVFH